MNVAKVWLQRGKTLIFYSKEKRIFDGQSSKTYAECMSWQV